MRYQLKITLDGIKPLIWRRVVVPGQFTLYDLHQVIQVAMGWEDCHMHDFTIKRQRYEIPDGPSFDDAKDETQTRLSAVVRVGSKFEYQYDFGDSWEHIILVEKQLDDADEAVPICTGGKRACPPEESGGAWGYSDKLDALSSDDDDVEAEEAREWMGEDFDPESFDLEKVNRDLQSIWGRAPRGKKASKRKK